MFLRARRPPCLLEVLLLEGPASLKARTGRAEVREAVVLSEEVEKKEVLKNKVESRRWKKFCPRSK